MLLVKDRATQKIRHQTYSRRRQSWGNRRHLKQKRFTSCGEYRATNAFSKRRVYSAVTIPQQETNECVWCWCSYSNFRPHRLHSVHKMRAIATDGVAWSICLPVCQCMCLSVWWSRLNRSRCRLVVTHVGLTNHVGPIGYGQDRTNPFAASRGNKLAMRPFAKLLWTLVRTLIEFVQCT